MSFGTWRFKSSFAHHEIITDKKATGMPASFYFISVIGSSSLWSFYLQIKNIHDQMNFENKTLKRMARSFKWALNNSLQILDAAQKGLIVWSPFHFN